MTLPWWPHAVTPLFKPREHTAPERTLRCPAGCGGRFGINVGTSPVTNAPPGGDTASGRGRGYLGNPYLPLNLAVNLELLEK